MPLEYNFEIRPLFIWKFFLLTELLQRMPFEDILALFFSYLALVADAHLTETPVTGFLWFWSFAGEKVSWLQQIL